MFDTTVSRTTGNETPTDIEVEIRKIIDARAARSGAYGVHFLELCDLAAAQLNGGKHLRPRLDLDRHQRLSTMPTHNPTNDPTCQKQDLTIFTPRQKHQPQRACL